MPPPPSAAFLRLRVTISDRLKRIVGRGLSGNGSQSADT
jgi:hypothetical protein